MDSDIRKKVIELLRDKLQRLSIRENELGSNFDLVKSGLLNSLEFVDMVASMEKIYLHEIDFEQALDAGEFTTIGGLIRAFENKNDGRD
jgi:acyl carrier protein